nr:hypothetical protein [Tanacetum cinerariifolium]
MGMFNVCKYNSRWQRFLLLIYFRAEGGFVRFSSLEAAESAVNDQHQYLQIIEHGIDATKRFGVLAFDDIGVFEWLYGILDLISTYVGTPPLAATIDGGKID